MQAENRSAQVNLRLLPTLKEAAEKAAAREHRSLTGLIEKLLTKHIDAGASLDEWHNRAFTRFLGVIEERKLREQIRLGTLTRSYRILTRQGDHLSPHTLIRELNSVYHALGNLLQDHHAFYPYARRPLAPYFIQDTISSRNENEEILECVTAPPDVEGVDLWRVSPEGLATHICIHREDEREESTGRGARFYPLYLTRHLADLVVHASVFAQRFPTADAVQFRCEWSGLRERELVGSDGRLDRRTHKVARADGRITSGEWPVGELGRSWPDVVSVLGGPVLRMFDPDFNYSGDWIRTAQLAQL